MREEGEGGVATPISFSIFDSYDMKSFLACDPNLVISSLASKGQDLKVRSL